MTNSAEHFEELVKAEVRLNSVFRTFSEAKMFKGEPRVVPMDLPVREPTREENWKDLEARLVARERK